MKVKVPANETPREELLYRDLKMFLEERAAYQAALKQIGEYVKKGEFDKIGRVVDEHI